MSVFYSDLSNLATLSGSRTRMISPENVYGLKGKGAMAEHGKPQPEVERIGQVYAWDGAQKSLGQRIRDMNGTGWKVRPYAPIPYGTCATIMDAEGPGVIQHVWMTASPAVWQGLVLRAFWDDEADPSIEVPVSHFFCNGWATDPATVVSVAALPINVNPTGGLNCYFPMPFVRRARITVENRSDRDCDLYYSILYAEGSLPPEAGYFHAQYRTYRPVPFKTEFAVADGIEGRGHFAGVGLSWKQNSPAWWGEGEVKFYLDGDEEYPSMVATGIEDYFGGAWCFKGNYSAPFLGYPSGASMNPAYMSAPGTKHTLYRFHLLDPIRFSSGLRVTMQALAHMPLEDDVSSAVYWYQAEPHRRLPDLPPHELVSRP